ncbi:MAG TPA: chemotaxis response regulator protein-glutamate methylesterase [Thermoanaerobaculia bacterium]|nr:chemotaxis response regulator protein-glutamate methylesterase [Thermoanaerobaculia bacterium]
MIDLLVVDDSAVMRQAFRTICARERDLAVRVASDPILAAARIREKRPDVILLDVEMPRMDGLTFLRMLMESDPIPVVICSALAGSGTRTALRALEEGAVDVVAKPKIGLREFLDDSAELLVDAVRSAAAARVRRRAPLAPVAPRHTADALLPRPRSRLVELTSRKLAAVGASTGGTEALRVLLEALPPDSPGLVVVQHMPAGFTAGFAQRLDAVCRIEVKEAADGDRVLDGRALIAPGDRHLVVRRDGAEYRVEVREGPLVSRHRPSVDVLFRSAAQAAGPNAVGVILTGMGNDGAEGLLEMKGAGARTFAQDEATSVVFGMPKEAIARGAVDEVLPLPRIPAAILGALKG